MAPNKNLSELLAEARGVPIRFGGFEVRAIYEISVRETSALRVSFDYATTARPQALRIRSEKVMLRVGNSRVKDMIFWTDTAPHVFDVIVDPPAGGGTIKVWNEWRDRAGIQNAWMGNAGMVVTVNGDVIVLKCSDGIGDPSFDDFVVSMRIVESTARVVDFEAHRQRRQSG